MDSLKTERTGETDDRYEPNIGPFERRLSVCSPRPLFVPERPNSFPQSYDSTNRRTTKSIFAAFGYLLAAATLACVPSAIGAQYPITEPLSTVEIEECTEVLMHYSKMGAVKLKFDYIESAWQMMSKDQRTSFLTDAAKGLRDVDMFAFVRLAREDLDRHISPGTPSCLPRLMTHHGAVFYRESLTTSERDAFVTEIDSALENLAWEDGEL